MSQIKRSQHSIKIERGKTVRSKKVCSTCANNHISTQDEPCYSCMTQTICYTKWVPKEGSNNDGC